MNSTVNITPVHFGGGDIVYSRGASEESLLTVDEYTPSLAAGFLILGRKYHKLRSYLERAGIWERD